MINLEKFYKLEEPLQDAISAEKTALIVYDLGEQNGLDKSGIGKLGELTRMVLMRELPLKDFAKEIEIKTGLPEDKAKIIEEKIDKDIFTPVKIYIIKKGDTQVVFKKEESEVFEKQKDIFDGDQ